MAVIDDGNASSTVPIAHDDGSLQISTVIDGPEAPTRYDHHCTLDGGGAAVLREDGAILLTDGEGEHSGAIAPAWAKDANGDALSTRYEVDGTTVTQVIEHGPGTV